MKKIILIFIFIFSSAFMLSAPSLGKKFSGRILLQVEGHGEAWYINPSNQKKYFLGHPQDAFNLMRALGLGITNNNLNKIPVGFLEENNDQDLDGLGDNLENALGTNPLEQDSDQDGYSDKDEILNNYDPLGIGPTEIDKNFVEQNLGKIFLQTEKNGEAWYIDPITKKRYFLGRPKDAFNLMRKKALGITNNNLNKISSSVANLMLGEKKESNSEEKKDLSNNNTKYYQTRTSLETISGAADAIRSGNRNNIKKYFVSNFHPAIDLIMNFYGTEGHLSLGNLLSSAKFKKSENNYDIYNTEAYFSLLGEKAEINFYVEKQENGEWLLTNL